MRDRRQHRISEHFSERDFVCRCGQCEGDLRISLGLVGGLEMLRARAKSRVNIIKGYVCPESQENSGRIRRNFHAQGVAADITVDRVSLKDTFMLAETIEEFKGIGLNLKDKCVHVDTRKEVERKLWVEEGSQVLDLTPENREHYFESLR